MQFGLGNLVTYGITGLLGIPAAIAWGIAMAVLAGRNPPDRREKARRYSTALVPLALGALAALLGTVMAIALENSEYREYSRENTYLLIWPMWALLLLLWVLVRKAVSRR